MRLLITIKARGNFKYDPMYHTKTQGLIYNLLKGTEYDHLHDKKGYKFFCFSNIFPPRDFKEDDIRNFIISSQTIF